VLLHLTHNGLLAAAALWPEGFGLQGEAVPWPWLLAGAAGAGLGAALLAATRRRPEPEA
jgi:hypothetical protein